MKRYKPLFESNSNLILYHGSIKKFNVFKQKDDYPIFLTDDPNFALSYAAAKGDSEESDEYGTVYKVKVSADIFNPLVPKDLSKIIDILPEQLVTRGDNWGIFTNDFSKQDWIDRAKKKDNNSWKIFENDVVIDAIKKAGFSGYVATERGSKTYAIFDVKDLKILGEVIETLHGWKDKK